MTTDRDKPWTLGWVVPPGEQLVEALADRGMSQAELARRIARPLKTISEIANGRAAITPDTAIQLERALGITAGFWNGLESRYREGLARHRADAELEDYTEWSKLFPIKELADHGLIETGDSSQKRTASLLAFFGVSSPAGWQQHWGETAARYRLARAVRVSPHALTAWLRWGEREAELLDLVEYDQSRFVQALWAARPLSRVAILEVMKERLVRSFADAGVALVILPSLTGAPASGAARWYRGRPMIQLTLRYLSDDQFWHSVYHEAGHIVGGRKGRDILEELDGDSAADDERLADDFARDQLVPSEALSLFLSRGKVDRKGVRAFATELGVSPGIVVGRLEHDGHLRPGQMRDLKRSLEPVSTTPR